MMRPKRRVVAMREQSSRRDTDNESESRETEAPDEHTNTSIRSDSGEPAPKKANGTMSEVKEELEEMVASVSNVEKRLPTAMESLLRSIAESAKHNGQSTSQTPPTSVSSDEIRRNGLKNLKGQVTAYTHILNNVTWEHPLWTDPLRGILIALVEKAQLELTVPTDVPLTTENVIAQKFKNMSKLRDVSSVLTHQGTMFSEVVVLEKWCWLCEMHYRSHYTISLLGQTPGRTFRFSNAMSFVPTTGNVFVGCLSTTRFNILCELFGVNAEEKAFLEEYDQIRSKVRVNLSDIRPHPAMSLLKNYEGDNAQAFEKRLAQVVAFCFMRRRWSPSAHADFLKNTAKDLAVFMRLCGLKVPGENEDDNWTPALVLKLIKLVEKCQSVWNISNVNRGVTRLEFIEIAEKLKKDLPAGGDWLTVESCTERWSVLASMAKTISKNLTLRSLPPPLDTFYDALSFVINSESNSRRQSSSPRSEETEPKDESELFSGTIKTEPEDPEHVPATMMELLANMCSTGPSTSTTPTRTTTPTSGSRKRNLQPGEMVLTRDMMQRFFPQVLGLSGGNALVPSVSSRDPSAHFSPPQKAVVHIQPVHPSTPQQEHVWVPPREEELLKQKNAATGKPPVSSISFPQKVRHSEPSTASSSTVMVKPIESSSSISIRPSTRPIHSVPQLNLQHFHPAPITVSSSSTSGTAPTGEDKWTYFGQLMAQHARDLERLQGPLAALQFHQAATTLMVHTWQNASAEGR